jgi:hypothetical protein
MWIFLNDAFLSVVADKHDPHGPRLLVRARREGDIERVFADAQVATTVDADYRFRAWLPRAQVAAVLQQQVEALAYPNFKSSIRDHAYHDAAMGAWSVMHRYQSEQAA